MEYQDIPGSPKFEPYTLLRSQKESIGSIILICSEIDHLISISLFKLSEIHADIGFSMFGKTSMGTMLKHLRVALKSAGKDMEQQFLDIDPDLIDFVSVRNMFAHGVFQGALENDLGFIVTADPSLDEEGIVLKVKRFHMDNFKPYEQRGTYLLSKIKMIFDVSPLHPGLPYRLQARKDNSKQSKRKSDAQ